MLAYRPGPLLDGLIELFWQLPPAPQAAIAARSPVDPQSTLELESGQPPLPVPSPERVLPTGTVELIFSLSSASLNTLDPRQPSQRQGHSPAVVVGPHNRHFLIDGQDPAPLLGVHFRPGGAFPVLGLPASELQDRHVPLQDLWGPVASQLRERLLEVSDPLQRFRVLEEALCRRVCRGPARHPVAAKALLLMRQAEQLPRIAELGAEVGLSGRRLRQVFAEEVGLSPKRLGRILRFQQLLQRLQQTDSVHWADLAVVSGYYDQAHCIHDFRRFSGLSPNAYLQRRGPRLNHVAL